MSQIVEQAQLKVPQSEIQVELDLNLSDSQLHLESKTELSGAKARTYTAQKNVSGEGHCTYFLNRGTIGRDTTHQNKTKV